MNYFKMNLFAVYISKSRAVLLGICFAMSVVFATAAEPVQSENKRRYSHFISNVWDTLAFWQSPDIAPQMHYLSEASPARLQRVSLIGIPQEEENNALLRLQKIPPRAHFSRTKIPSFKDFLEDLEIERTEVPDVVIEDSEIVSAEPISDEKPAVVAEVVPVEDSPTTQEGEDPYASDVEAVFPRPYEKFVSGGRLLMFYPLDHSSAVNGESSTLMLPYSSLMDFQPPSTHPGRSSATFIEE